MTVGSKVLDNETFSESASALMKSRLDDYNKAKATPTPTAAPNPTPTPTPTPTRTPQAGSTAPPDHSNVKVYLSFFGLDPELTPRILTALQLRSTPAAFFVSADEIAAYPDLIRRISGSGHMLGLICGEELESDYSAASALLFDAAHTSAFMVARELTFNTGEEAEAESGLIIYCAPSDAASLELSACLRALEKAEERMDLIFITAEQTADDLPTLLRTMRSENYNIARLTEVRAAEYSGG